MCLLICSSMYAYSDRSVGLLVPKSQPKSERARIVQGATCIILVFEDFVFLIELFIEYVFIVFYSSLCLRLFGFQSYNLWGAEAVFDRVRHLNLMNDGSRHGAKDHIYFVMGDRDEAEPSRYRVHLGTMVLG